MDIRSHILLQTKNYNNKNKLVPYLLESFKNSADFTVTGGTVVNDSVNFKSGTYGLQLTTAAANSNIKILKNVSWNLSGATDFELKFFVPDKTNLANVALYLYTATGQAYSFKASFIAGWNTLRFTKSDFTLSNMTWQDLITSFNITVYSSSGGVTNITLDSLKKDVKDDSNIIFCFDDGYKTAYTIGIPYLESKGLKGNCAVYKQSIGTYNYMTEGELTDIYFRGHDVINHSTTHPNNLGTYTYTNCAKEIQDMRDYLYNLGITRGDNILVYPSSYSTMAYQVAKDLGYVMARHSSGELNHGQDNLLNLQSRNPNATSVIGDVTKFIDRISITGGLLIIFVHDLQEAPTGSNCGISLFKSIVDYAFNSKVKITTFSTYYKSLFE